MSENLRVNEELTPVEYEIFYELNQARENPSGFLEKVRRRRQYYKGKEYHVPGEIPFKMKEGESAVDEAIAFMERQQPISPFQFSMGLTLAARDHIGDMCSKGYRGHTGSDKSVPSERITRYCEGWTTIGENIGYGEVDAFGFVVELIVDDGVADRGHRANIFNPAFGAVGIACGSHPKERSACVIDLADQGRDVPMTQLKKHEYEQVKAEDFEKLRESGVVSVGGLPSVPGFRASSSSQPSSNKPQAKCMLCTVV